MIISNGRNGLISFRTGKEPKTKLVKLKPGANEVEESVWAAVYETNRAWVDNAVETGVLIIGGMVLPVTEPEPERLLSKQRMNAADVIEIIKTAESIEEVHSLIEGDDRKTVRDAAEKRVTELMGDG